MCSFFEGSNGYAPLKSVRSVRLSVWLFYVISSRWRTMEGGWLMQTTAKSTTTTLNVVVVGIGVCDGRYK